MNMPLNENNEKSYKWKGLMIDCARHMPSVSYLYKTIDRMYELGLNVLHLHLSDDQGFRFESKKYPKLNTIGSIRSETVVEKNFPSKWTRFTKFIGDGKRYAGYYSQSEIRELCKYAKQKDVTIVPEIDIPGHVTAILASYPEFSEKDPPLEVAKYWGIFENVLSNKEETIIFLKNLFEEVCNCFDTDYIHIGGDEVEHNAYKDHKDYENILLEIIKYLKSKNKKVILWDEASEVALETDSIIMNWREIDIGIKQLSLGGEVIFCPNKFFYFDYYQKDPSTEPLAIGGYLPKETVASFKIEDKVWKKYGDKILGIQANLWTEYLNTEDKMDYMLYPRLEVFSQLKP